MNNKKVSIVIHTYNRADNLSRSINSLLQQTYKDFEILIVDDGSTDNTQEVALGFEDTRYCSMLSEQIKTQKPYIIY